MRRFVASVAHSRDWRCGSAERNSSRPLRFAGRHSKPPGSYGRPTRAPCSLRAKPSENSSKTAQLPDKRMPASGTLRGLDLQLGRLPFVLAWIEMAGALYKAVELDEKAHKAVQEEWSQLDFALGLLLLRTDFFDLKLITNLGIVTASAYT